MKRLFLMAAMLGACTTEPAGPQLPDHRVTWADHGTSTSLGPVACGTLISHPCPWILFTHLVTIDLVAGGTVNLTWDPESASGGVDSNGAPADHHQPELETATLTAAGLELGDRGDDAGLRHAVTIPATATGYEGDVEWSLFTVAGHTSFHVVIDVPVSTFEAGT